MVTTLPAEQRTDIVYPESDGKPMADNTRQFRYIVMIQGGLDALFADHEDVFVAGDLLWYPVEGAPKIRAAPDIMVAFGRPKGDRDSYLQWQEDGIAPQVVFEILSPGNTVIEMGRKFDFYERYGVEEYYVYDPDRNELAGWQREGNNLRLIDPIEGWASPRLHVRFSYSAGELHIYRPDGRRFATFVELEQARAQAEQAREQAEQAREQERQRAEQAEHAREQERLRAERLLAQLRALGVEPRDDE
ncbi:MAG TPA: Uma2 family endonuclease [Roseiflexaceae bacterium]|nr:Uma2 family endonuclease [Roseiflexaceae bacterium]